LVNEIFFETIEIHRQDACSTERTQARCLFHRENTGKMLVPQREHRQDACSTERTQARCLFHRERIERRKDVQNS